MIEISKLVLYFANIINGRRKNVSHGFLGQADFECSDFEPVDKSKVKIVKTSPCKIFVWIIFFVPLFQYNL